MGVGSGGGRGLALAGGERQADKLGQALDVDLVHHPRAMDLDGARADRQFVRDDLVRLADHQQAQNVAFALAVKAVFLVATLLGMSTLWMAVFADTGAALIVIANGMRLLGYRPRALPTSASL